MYILCTYIMYVQKSYGKKKAKITLDISWILVSPYNKYILNITYKKDNHYLTKKKYFFLIIKIPNFKLCHWFKVQ